MSVTSFALDAVLDWLACPVCAQPLHRQDRSLSCSSGHSFDIARQGYVNLLRHAAPANADTAPMVAARERFLASGLYAPIADLVADWCVNRVRLAEIGAGPGYYLRHVLERHPDSHGVALDVSPAACRRAATTGLAAVVADTWAGLPLQDGCLDALLCVFAPRNPGEFARVLAPGGRLIVVTPNPGHLAELRQRLGLLGIQTGKAERISDQFTAVGMRPARVHRLAWRASATRDQLADLVTMGPNAFHHPPTPQADAEIQIDVSVTCFVR